MKISMTMNFKTRIKLMRKRSFIHLRSQRVLCNSFSAGFVSNSLLAKTDSGYMKSTSTRPDPRPSTYACSMGATNSSPKWETSKYTSELILVIDLSNANIAGRDSPVWETKETTNEDTYKISKYYWSVCQQKVFYI
jgi:hypothetical protein